MSYCLMDSMTRVKCKDFFWRGAEWKRSYGILFISMPLYGLLVPLLLESYSILFYLVGFQLVFERYDFPYEPLFKVSRSIFVFACSCKV